MNGFRKSHKLRENKKRETVKIVVWTPDGLKFWSRINIDEIHDGATIVIDCSDSNVQVSKHSAS